MKVNNKNNVYLKNVRNPYIHTTLIFNSHSFDMSVVLHSIHRIQLSLFGPALHLFLPASFSGTGEGEWLLFALLHWSLTDVEDLYSVRWSTALSSSANHSLCVSPIPSKVNLPQYKEVS